MRILHVCTGNICRSPMAEHLMRDGLKARDVAGISVSSAGTYGLEGSPIQEFAGKVLIGQDIDPSRFRARLLQAEHVERADLVLTASREHRTAVVSLVPDAVSRTFTLREFDRLLSELEVADLPADPIDRARALVGAAARARGRVRAERPADDDIADPYGGPAAAYEPCGRLITDVQQRWLDLVAGRPQPVPAQSGPTQPHE